MNRLISLEPSNIVPIRIEPEQKCYGELTLFNVMHTMPVAFKIQATNKSLYSVKPQSGIISPLATLTIEITYHLPPGSLVPDSFPHCEDSFLLHSVVVPGAAIKDPTFDSVPNDWFTNKKKQVYIDSGIRILFVGSSVLAQLVVDGSMEEIREVLESSDPSWNLVNSVDSHGQTLLHIAIAQGRADIVQLLLEFEPEVDLSSQWGTTPLEAASGCGDALIAELLLARKASTERAESSVLGPIHLAAQGGHIEVLKLLLLKEANVDSLTKDGNTALHIAVEEGRRECARMLLASGAGVDLRNSSEGNTALHIAARLGDEHMVNMLLAKVANKDIRNNIGKTAFEIAAENGYARLFNALKLGDTLCVAARKGDVKTIHRLIKKGAAINGRDQNGWTALHRAAFKGKIKAIQALLDKGIDTNTKDEDGYTALHCAVESGNADVIEFLIKKGVDIDAKTNKGVTALQIAQAWNYTGIARILINGGASKDGVNCVHDTVAKGIEKVVKRKPTRARVLSSSFDRSMPLVVL